jgi:hypothetical protein
VGDLYALVSAGGSPGVTTAALALTLTWPSPVILAECDPSGGAVLAGLLCGHVSASHGLMQHAMEAGRGVQAAAASLPGQLVPLDANRTRTVLAGLTDPRQSTGLAPAWPGVAAALAAQASDVIADCGRLDAGPGQPLAVLAAARTVALVLRPTLRQVWSARSRVDMLSQLLGGTARLAVLLTATGAHTAREVAHALDLPVAATLPDDPRTAAWLSDGTGSHHRAVSGQLLRSAKTAGSGLRARVAVTRQAAGAGASR